MKKSSDISNQGYSSDRSSDRSSPSNLGSRPQTGTPSQPTNQQQGYGNQQSGNRSQGSQGSSGQFGGSGYGQTGQTGNIGNQSGSSLGNQGRDQNRSQGMDQGRKSGDQTRNEGTTTRSDDLGSKR